MVAQLLETPRHARFCPECGRPTRYLVEGLCNPCNYARQATDDTRPKPMQRKKGGWHRRLWTPEEDAILRREYRIGKAGEVYQRLATQFGRSAATVRYRASALGITRPGWNRKAWTEAEDRRLEELYGRYMPKRVAVLMGRTYASVTGRAATLGLQAKYHDGWYTCNEAAHLLAVDTHWVADRIKSGAIKATKDGAHRTGYWRIEASDLRAFILRCPTELQGRPVQMVAFIELIREAR